MLQQWQTKTSCSTCQNIFSIILVLVALSKVVSHDTRKFRFALQSPEHILGLPIGVLYHYVINFLELIVGFYFM